MIIEPGQPLGAIHHKETNKKTSNGFLQNLT